MVVFHFTDIISSVSFTIISESSLIVDNSGTIISVLHTVKCVNQAIVSATDLIIDGPSTIVAVPHITVSIPHTIIDGTPTVIGGSETIISTMETVISLSVDMVISNLRTSFLSVEISVSAYDFRRSDDGLRFAWRIHPCYVDFVKSESRVGVFHLNVTAASKRIDTNV